MQEGSLLEMEGRKGRGEQGRWRGCVGKGGGVEGAHSFILIHLLPPSVVVVICRFEAGWGVHGGTQCGSVQ